MSTITPAAVSACWALFAIGGLLFYVGQMMDSAKFGRWMANVGLGLWVIVILRTIPLVFQ